jgi:TetR/AcrR family transcriptional repressor of lmrAB and yxaGH operons
MSAPLLAKEEVSQRIFGVFRTYGYEGATLARISVATGLGRASLYHYYPGGKDDMAREVLGTARGWLESNVVAALERPGGHAARLRAMTAALRAGYAEGEASCVLNLLGVGEAGEKFASDLRLAIDVWIHALEKLLRGAGAPPARARRTALDTIVRIEGALVVGRALGDNAVFTRTLSELERALIDEVEHHGASLR